MLSAIQSHDHDATSSFLPHGFCYLWDPQLLWTHVIADFLIGTAYIIIAVSLAWLVHRLRSDIPFSWAFVAFGIFIIACGMTHYVEIWTLWDPAYWFSGGVKVVTAVASVATAIAMPFTVPRAVSTVRDARLARERELAEARAAVLEEQNALLRQQALELERQRTAAEDLATELEETNAALTRALQEADEARAFAEAASEAKSVFLRTMSHELRTPLNAVIGYSELLELGTSGPLTPQQQDYVGRITRSAGHLLALINEVLILTRQLKEWRDPELQETRLGDVMSDVRDMLSPQAEKMGPRLTFADVPDVTLVTDPQWLRQILLNVLSNALKFTAEGEIVVKANASDDELTVSVSDTGIGIDATHHELIFQPFWQAEQGTTRNYEGTGLGLSVSRELARRLGGDLTVESRPGHGSVFTLRLPRR